MMRVLVLGEDSTAYFLARRLDESGHRVTIVASDESRALHLSRTLEVPVLHGHAARAEVLDDAGALGADVLVALTDRDHDNLVACQVGRRVFSIPRTVAVVNDPGNRDVFRSLGVDEVVSVTELLAGVIGQTAVFDQIAELVAVAEGRLLVSDVVLPEGAPGTSKTLAELRAGSSGLVATVLRGDEIIVPDGSTRLMANDRLVVVTQPGARSALLRALLGEGAPA